MKTLKISICVVSLATLLAFVSAPAAAVTWYRVSDLQAWGGGGAPDPSLGLNDLIPPDSGWVLLQATQSFETGHIIGWGLHDGDPRVFGLTPLAAGDANADGKVDSGDLAIWQQGYSPVGGETVSFFKGDFNDDGRIDSGDLALWQQNYNPVASADFPYEPSAVHMPEPVTVLGLIMGVSGIGIYIRRRRLA